MVLCFKKGVNTVKEIYSDKRFFEISHSVSEHPKQSEFYMHAHEHYELLLFIAGDVSYLVEGVIYQPEPYDILIFNIAETHKVIINSETKYERTVIKIDKDLFKEIDPTGELFLPFNSRINGQNNLMSSSVFSDPVWRLCLNRLQIKGKSKIHYISNLLPLLNEICNVTDCFGDSYLPDTLAERIVKYVNDNITANLIPEEIAKRFFISKTTFYKVFKNSTGTTFHNYVTTKRLIIARELLRLGNKPTYVASQCGFSEYSTFYRLYKKQFKESPKVIREYYITD